MIEEYLKATKQLRNYSDAAQDPHFTKVSKIEMFIVYNHIFLTTNIIEHACNNTFQSVLSMMLHI